VFCNNKLLCSWQRFTQSNIRVSINHYYNLYLVMSYVICCYKLHWSWCTWVMPNGIWWKWWWWCDWNLLQMICMSWVPIIPQKSPPLFLAAAKPRIVSHFGTGLSRSWWKFASSWCRAMCTALAVAIRSLADLCCVFLLLCCRNPRNQNTDEIFVANLHLKVARKTRLCLSMKLWTSLISDWIFYQH